MNRLMIYLLVGLVGLSNLSLKVAAQCGPRVRKDWDDMTQADKDTYKAAIASAMDSGAYIKFVEMHTEMMSEREAHGQCMFIYWHRYFLVVFENMLRGQGDEFACVTIPYWNWMTAQDRTASGLCSTFGDCSSITTELGGWTNGSPRALTINGVDLNSFTCVSTPPLDHFCESSDVSGDSCAKCVPRGDWGAVKVENEVSFASVYAQIFSGSNIGQVSPKIEHGCHARVHANLRGAMERLISPADPIFWSHHSMIDALHTIFHKCRVGSARMTFEQKAVNSAAWSSCSRRNNGGKFNPADTVTMRTGVDGTSPVNGSADPLIGAFFDGVPSRFADLMDVRDLGDNSYSYEANSTGFLATMYMECDANTTLTPLPTSMPAFDRKLSTTDAPKGETSEQQGGNSQTSSPAHSIDDGKIDVVIKKGDCGASTSTMISWYRTTMRELGGQCPENREQLELMSCLFQDRCLGGYTVFSDKFKQTWGVTEPRCKTIVDAYHAGQVEIYDGMWQQKMEANFGCPVPLDTPEPTAPLTKSPATTDSPKQASDQRVPDQSSEQQLPNSSVDQQGDPFVISTLIASKQPAKHEYC